MSIGSHSGEMVVYVGDDDKKYTTKHPTKSVDKFASAYGKGIISHKAMLARATREYESYRARVLNNGLSGIKQQYLEELKTVQKRV